MSKKIVQLADHLENVTRRGFISGTAGIITAASGVTAATVLNSQKAIASLLKPLFDGGAS